MADARGIPFVPLHSLAEARAYPDGVVILQGDDGGQIYVVCPASEVRCDEAALESLLVDLDEIAWPSNPPDMRRVLFERISPGCGVAGGMGGGRVTEGPWVHPEFDHAGLAAAVVSVLRGERARIR
jgi:hypothetical protein